MADAESGKPGILYVANRPKVTPEPEWSDAELLDVLREVYADARWVDLGRIVLEVRDPETPWEEALRYYFNTPASGLGAFVDPRRWAELATSGSELAPGSSIALGFDGSVSHDATAIVACDLDGKLYPIGLWERPHDATDWRVPRLEVAAAIARAFDTYDVVRMLADPYHWRTEIEQWELDHGEDIVLEYPTNSAARMTPALDRFRVAVSEGTVTNNGDKDLARHIANARLRATRGGHVLDEAGPRRYFDAAIAAVLAFEAAMTAPPKSNLEPVVRTGQKW
jgi:phage terminase large subunit-like protein